jgi:hypothetical protein
MVFRVSTEWRDLSVRRPSLSLTSPQTLTPASTASPIMRYFPHVERINE